MPAKQRIIFPVLPHVHALDLSGPAQVFYEAGGFGGAYDLIYCSARRSVRSAQGFTLGDLDPLPEVTSRDWVLVPGIASDRLDEMRAAPLDWIRAAAAAGARIGSICSGAWVIAMAGVLDGRSCTTHWKIADRMQRTFPRLRVLADRLFVRDGPVITSAGVASGIDMALSMVEEDHGTVMVGRIAREMVVYLRRDGASPQTSVFVDHRTHLYPGIHRVQDHLVAHPGAPHTLESLAEIAAMSPRHLTRVFRRATGTSLKRYTTMLRLEVAEGLLRNPALGIERIAADCGFSDPRQFRRLWKKAHGTGPSEWRKRHTPAGGERAA